MILSPYSDAEIEEAVHAAAEAGLLPESGVVRIPEEQPDPCTAEDTWGGVPVRVDLVIDWEPWLGHALLIGLAIVALIAIGRFWWSIWWL